MTVTVPVHTDHVKEYSRKIETFINGKRSVSEIFYKEAEFMFVYTDNSHHVVKALYQEFRHDANNVTIIDWHFVNVPVKPEWIKIDSITQLQ